MALHRTRLYELDDAPRPACDGYLLIDNPLWCEAMRIKVSNLLADCIPLPPPGPPPPLFWQHTFVSRPINVHHNPDGSFIIDKEGKGMPVAIGDRGQVTATLWRLQIQNGSSQRVYVKFFNLNRQPNPGIPAHAPVFMRMIEPLSTDTFDTISGIPFPLGLWVSAAHNPDQDPFVIPAESFQVIGSFWYS